eukprot:468555-Pleurochrysis_carterae.AAC.5
MFLFSDLRSCVCVVAFRRLHSTGIVTEQQQALGTYVKSAVGPVVTKSRLGLRAAHCCVADFDCAMYATLDCTYKHTLKTNGPCELTRGRIDEIVRAKASDPKLMGSILCFEFIGVHRPSLHCAQPVGIFDGQASGNAREGEAETLGTPRERAACDIAQAERSAVVSHAVAMWI